MAQRGKRLDQATQQMIRRLALPVRQAARAVGVATNTILKYRKKAS